MKKPLILLSVVALCVTGCTTYKSASGTKYSNFLFRKQVSVVELTDPDGSRLRVEGLKSDASEAFQTINEAIKRYPVPASAAPSK